MFPSHFEVLEQKAWVLCKRKSSSYVKRGYGIPEAGDELGKWRDKANLGCRSRAPALNDVLLGNVTHPGIRK